VTRDQGSKSTMEHQGLHEQEAGIEV
jgi:hypothetical protein